MTSDDRLAQIAVDLAKLDGKLETYHAEVRTRLASHDEQLGVINPRLRRVELRIAGWAGLGSSVGVLVGLLFGVV